MNKHFKNKRRIYCKDTGEILSELNLTNIILKLPKNELKKPKILLFK